VAAATPPGQWADFVIPGLNLSASGAPSVPSIITYAARGLWDPARKQMSFYGQAHGGGQIGIPNCAGFVRWDDLTNTWYKEEYASHDLDGNHAYHHLTVNPSTGICICVVAEVLRRAPGSSAGGAWETGHVTDIYPPMRAAKSITSWSGFRS
jgi:hypothetical protein